MPSFYLVIFIDTCLGSRAKLICYYYENEVWSRLDPYYKEIFIYQRILELLN